MRPLVPGPSEVRERAKIATPGNQAIEDENAAL